MVSVWVQILTGAVARVDGELEAWAREGVRRGFAVRSGHHAYDGTTWVPTLVLQTTKVKALHG